MSISNLAGEQVYPTGSAMSVSLNKPQKSKSVSLLKIDDDNILRHESLAYLDGYADAKQYGEKGFFMDMSYARDARERYADGFKKGLRVHKVLHRISERMTPRQVG